MFQYSLTNTLLNANIEGGFYTVVAYQLRPKSYQAYLEGLGDRMSWEQTVTDCYNLGWMAQSDLGHQGIGHQVALMLTHSLSH